MAERETRREVAPVPGAPTPALTPGVEAAAEAWAPLGYGEGARVGILGDSGVGKSTAERELIREWTKRSPGVVIVLDDKGPRQRFDGRPFRDLAAMRGEIHVKPLEPTDRVLVFRGDCFAGYKVDREEIASYSWKLIGRRQPCLVVHDELKEACAGGQWKSGSLWLPRSFSQGREVGLSQLWGTQDTQEVPAEAFNQSSSLLCFKIAGNGLRLLRSRDYISGGVDDVIARLPGDDVEPAARGAFVLLRRGKPWNGKTYRFTPPAE
jgi:hypothetical protein